MNWLQKGGSACRHLLRVAVQGKTAGSAAMQSIVLAAASLVVTLTSGMMLARGLGPHDRGVFAAASMWPYIIGIVSAVGSDSGLLICCSRSPSRMGNYTSSAFLFVSLLVTILSVGFATVIAPRIVFRNSAETYNVFILCLPFAVPAALGILAKQVLYAQNKFLRANASAFVQHLTYALVITVLYLLGALTVRTAAVAFLIGGFTSFLVIAPGVMRTFRGSFSRNVSALREILGFAFRAAPGDLLTIAAAFSDRILLITLISPSALGHYVVAYSFSRLVNVILPASSILIRAMSVRGQREAKELHDFVLRVMAPLLILVLSVLEFGAGEAVRLLFGAKFSGAVPILRVLAIECALSCVASIGSQLYASLNKPGLNSAIQALSAAVTIAVIVTLAPHWGGFGGAVGLLIGTSTRVALLWGGMAVGLGVGMPDARPRKRDVSTVWQMLRRAGP